MIEALLLIGFWLFYMLINVLISAMSKEPLFTVLAHGVMLIIFVGLRWLLQGYLNEQYAMQYYLHHSDISLLESVVSQGLLGIIVFAVIICVVLSGFMVTTYGPMIMDVSHLSPSGIITYALAVCAALGIVFAAGPSTVSTMDLKTESTRIVNEQTFQPGQDGITFEMQSEKDAPWESVTQPHTFEELRRADLRAVRGSNTSELKSWKTTIQPKNVTADDSKAFVQWVKNNNIPIRVVEITRQRVVERKVHPRYPRIHKDQEYDATVITYELVDSEAYTQYQGSKSLDNLVNPK